MCKVLMKPEKVTKNKIRFIEVVEPGMNEPIVGTTYFPKTTLKAMGWEDGKYIQMDFKAVDPEENKAIQAAQPVKRKPGRPCKQK